MRNPSGSTRVATAGGWLTVPWSSSQVECTTLTGASE
jgi:hypothetical protein